MALARLFMQNTAPTLWEVEQFQELMLNLAPEADAKTRQDLLQLLSLNMHTPTHVLDALEMKPIQGMPKNEGPDNIPPVDPVPQQQPVYSIARLKDMLPLQISRKMTQVAALAAERGDRHILRSLLASQLSVSRQFADYLLINPDGLLLATALRALRMPSANAHTILLASEGLESRDLIYVPQMINSFERLDPEACRKRLRDWERAFSRAQAETIAAKQGATVQPNDQKPGFNGRNIEDVRDANEPNSDGQRMVG
ncbi:hypothetical protein [Pararhizobium sp. IMCC21322]|uniref:hypothetical protein n=1 Tax=Pararhizobium sp. IMCC21322 TaxID=3067903 RepID=UPI002740C69D|nr:hypothetical protein [Pararhizobium sp. IMCC21322]